MWVIQWLIFNYTADYLALYFIRDNRYGSVSNYRLGLAALIAVITYVSWLMTENSLMIILAFSVPLIAYPIHRIAEYIQVMTMLLLWECLLGGIGTALQQYIAPVITFPILCLLSFLLTKKIKKENQKKVMRSKHYNVHIERKGLQLDINGYYDSGNLLKSQITGKGIYILDKKYAKKILTEQEKKIIDQYPTDKNLQIYQLEQAGIYDIIYSSVGKKKGIIPAVIAERIIISQFSEKILEEKGMIGLCDHDLFRFHSWQMLLPEDCEKQMNNWQKQKKNPIPKEKDSL